MNALLMVLIGFFLGSLPFSIWIGKLFLGVDVRRFGDGNPGATNVFRAGNRPAGVVSLMLDISKAAAPVGVAYFNMNIRGAEMFLIAIAPILGHAFSPFLRFRGGKALATALGVWIGLTIWKASLPVLAGICIGVLLFRPYGWAVLFSLFTLLVVLLAWMPDPLLLSVCLFQILFLSWKHLSDLRQGIHILPWVRKLFTRPKH